MLSAILIYPSHIQYSIKSHTVVTLKECPAFIEPLQWTLFMHGAFGRGKNWQSIAQKWVDMNTGKGMPQGAILLDLPWHGFSQPTDPEMDVSMENAAGLIHTQIIRLTQAQWHINQVVAHSLGGKLAMTWAQLLTEQHRNMKFMIVDSTPEVIDAQDQGAREAWRTLEVLKTLPLQFESRNAFTEKLTKAGVLPAVAMWLAQNLVSQNDAFRFGLPLESLTALFADFYSKSLWDIVEKMTAKFHFIRASRGSVMTENAWQRLKGLAMSENNAMSENYQGRISYQMMTGGHWLHVDNPDGMLEAMASQFGINSA